MKRRGRRWAPAVVFVVVATVAVIAAAAMVWWLLASEPSTEKLEWWASWAQILGVPLMVLVPLTPAAWLMWRRWARGRGPITAEQLDAAQAYLARETLVYWRQQAHTRGITTPVPLRVSWRHAPSNLAPPVTDRSEPRLLTAGVVTDLLDQRYLRLERSRRRVVLVGEAGTGKTATMLLLLIRLLERREQGTLPGEPVPVWLTLGSWNPDSSSLVDHAARVLLQTYPSLRNEAYGGPAGVVALINSGRVALFLDGLDEMPEQLRGRALSAIDAFAQQAGVPVVMTSRPEEYRTALDQGVLHHVTGVEVLPLDPAADIDLRAIREFLLTEQLEARREAWTEVLDHIQAHPDGVLAQTLTTALALSLARDTYTTPGGDDPRDLLDEQAFPNREALMGHLIARLLHQAYPDPTRRTHAVHWLAWTATHLQGSDIAWWHIPTWIPRHHSQLTLGLVGGLAFGLAFGLVVGLAFGLAVGLAVGLAFGLAVGLAVGLAFGLAVGLMGGLKVDARAEPKALMMRCASRKDLIWLAVGLVGGLGVGLVSGLEVELVSGLEVELEVELEVRLGVGLMAGLAGALAIGLAEAWSVPVGSAATTPMASYRSDRRLGLVRGPLGGLAIGMTAWLAIGMTAGLAVALAAGLAYGLVFGPAWQPSGMLWAAEVALWAKQPGRGRARFMALFEDALEQQVLRQVGPYYQFRHGELQDRVARLGSDPIS